MARFASPFGRLFHYIAPYIESSQEVQHCEPAVQEIKRSNISAMAVANTSQVVEGKEIRLGTEAHRVLGLRSRALIRPSTAHQIVISMWR